MDRDVSGLLVAWREGDEGALGRLMPLVYAELRRLAHHLLRGQKRDVTVQTTALVHDAFLRLAGWRNADCQDRSHFFAVSASLMRRALVDVVRSHASQKRGGGALHVSLDSGVRLAPIPGVRQPEIIALDEALRKLAILDRRKASVVELRYFGGLTVEETCEALGVSRATVERDWQLARLWLSRELGGRGS